MKSAFLLFVSLFVFFSSGASAVEFFRRVEYPVQGVYIPDGFDNNDSVQFVIDGKFPNSCFQVGYASTELEPETNKLFVSLIAYEYVGSCSDYGAPFHQVVHAGMFRKAGSYGVYDRKSGTYLGALNIGQAVAAQAGTDENAYPPVLDGFFTDTSAGKQLVLRGTVPWSCLKVSDVKILVQENVVVVLPRMTRGENQNCVVGEFPYEISKPVTEKLPRSEFLLHIRSMGGQSINKIVSAN